MNGHERTSLEMVKMLYDAVHDPRLLPSFFDHLLSNLKGTTALLFMQDLRKRNPVLDTLVCWNPIGRSEYGTTKNFWLIRSEPMLSAGASIGAIQAEKNLICSEYADRLGSHNVAGTRLTVLQPESKRKFDPVNMELLRLLLPHLQRAFSLHQTIIDLRMEKEAAREVLDRFPLGIILVDDRERVTLLNVTAKQIVDKNDNLGIADGKLKGNEALRTLVRQALRPEFSQKSPQGEYVCVPRRSDARPWPVLVSSLSSYSRIPGVDDRPTVAIFVRELNRPFGVTQTALMRCFKLTRAESRVTLHLLNGKNLQETSRELEISLDTAKTHLKNIFAKTETRSQSDLIRLILGGLPEMGGRS